MALDSLPRRRNARPRPEPRAALCREHAPRARPRAPSPLPPREAPQLEPARPSTERLEHSLLPGEAGACKEAPPLECSERFEELELLGSGGSGVVTLARDLQSGEQVALKRLRRSSPHTLRRFLKEAETISRLQHPGIVRLQEVWGGEVEGIGPGLTLVFEHVEGPTGRLGCEVVGSFWVEIRYHQHGPYLDLSLHEDGAGRRAENALELIYARHGWAGVPGSASDTSGEVFLWATDV